MLGALLVATCAALGAGDLTLQWHSYGVRTCFKPSIIGNYAFYPCGRTGLTVFDVSDRTNPTPVGSYFATSHTYSTHAEGDLLYVANGGGLRILDVSTPSQPTLVGSLSNPGPRALGVKGGYAYLGTGSQVKVVDVRDPAAPLLLAVFYLPATVQTLIISGDFIYVGLFDGVLAVVSIANPIALVLVKSVSLVRAKALAVEGTSLFAATSWSVLVFDISNPASLGAGRTLYYGSDAHDVAVDGGRVYIRRWRTLLVIDTSSYVVLGQLTTGSGTLIEVADGVGYSGQYGIQLLDVANPASMSELGEWSTPVSGARDVSLSGDGSIAYVCDQYRGLFIYDVSGAVPVLLSTYTVWGALYHVTDGGYAYVALVSATEVIDVRDPRAPVLLGRVTGELPEGVEKAGDHLYVVTGDRLNIYNVANPLSPVGVSSTIVSAGCKSVNIIEGYVYIGSPSSVLSVFDVSNLQSPVLVHSLTGSAGSAFRGIKQAGQVAYAAYEVQGLVVLDISDPAAPTVAATWQQITRGLWVYAKDIALGDGLVYISGEFGMGLTILDVADPTAPVQIASHPGYTFANSVAVHEDRVYVADFGFFVYTFAKPDPTPEPTPVPTPEPTEPTPVPTPEPTTITKYEIGCFKSNMRFLTHEYKSEDNTPDRCATQCAAAGYTHAGVEYGRECWCGDNVEGAVKTVTEECKARACTGDSADYCGGGYRVRLYSLVAPFSQPVASEVGCFATDKRPRSLDALGYVSSANTVAECTSVCAWNGYKYAGLEYGDECWCGETLPEVRVGKHKCSRPCAGDASENCGSGYRANVYLVDGPAPPLSRSYMGCYVDEASRTLPVLGFKDAEGCTIDECVAVCAHNGHRFSGLQHSRECWCGGSLPPIAAPEGACNKPCGGDTTQTCGGRWRNSVYSLDP